MSLPAFTYWYWFLFAIVFLVMELLSGSGFLLWAAVSALITGSLAAWLSSWTWQLELTLFCSLALVLIMLWWAVAKRAYSEQSSLNLNQRAQQNVGRLCQVSNVDESGRGKVEIDGVTWLVRAEEVLKAGNRVRVIGVDGAMLVVEVAKDA